MVGPSLAVWRSIRESGVAADAKEVDAVSREELLVLALSSSSRSSDSAEVRVEEGRRHSGYSSSKRVIMPRRVESRKSKRSGVS